MRALRYYLAKILYILPAKRSSLVFFVLVFLLVSVLEVFGIGLINPFINLSGNLDLIEQHHWLHLPTRYPGCLRSLTLLHYLGY